MPNPYAGNPNNFPAVVEVPGGSDPPSSAIFQTTFEGEIDRTAYLYARGAAAVQEWRPAWLGTAIFGTAQKIQAACWDSTNAQWLLLGVTAAGSYLEFYGSLGADDGSATYWTALGGQATNVGLTSAICAASGTPWVVTASPTNLYVYSGVGSTLERTVSGKTALQNPEVVSFGGYVIYAVGSTVSGEVTISYASTGAPTVWTDVAVGAAATEWALKANTGIVLAVPIESSTTTTPNYYHSTDGHTWTSSPLSNMGATSSAAVVGLCWSPTTALWYAVVSPSGITLETFTSPDGLTWTAVTMVTTTNPGIVDIAALGSGLVGTIGDSSGGGSRLVFSIDGGATWYESQASFATSENGGSTYRWPRVAQGDFGVLAYNNLWGRFSRYAGLPANHL